MKEKITTLIFFTISFFSYSQVSRLDMTVTYDENNQKTILIKTEDYQKFEHYYNCSKDQGYILKSNLKDGTYEVYENDTLSYRAFYYKNKKDSIWTYYNKNGTFYETIAYKKGKKHGLYKHYVNNELYNEGNYIEDKMNGIWKYYNPNGTISKISYFELNNKINEVEFYESGIKKNEEQYYNGKYHGKNIEYFENGKQKIIKFYNLDKLSRRILYDENGEIISDKSF